MVLPASGTISLDMIHQVAAGFTGAVAVEVKPISGNYTLRTNNDWTHIKVWAIGGGGSGGAASTDARREKVATGGGAGGTAVRTYIRGNGISSYSVTIGGGGGKVTASGQQTDTLKQGETSSEKPSEDAYGKWTPE